MCRTSSGRSICLYPSQNGGCSKIVANSKRPDIWIRLPRHKWSKSWYSMEDPIVPLERNLCGHPLAGLLWERQFQKVLVEHGWEKAPNWEWLFVNRAKGLFLSVYADDFWLTGKKQNIYPTWEILIGKMLSWENQHHSLTTFTSVAFKENQKSAKILLTITQQENWDVYVPSQGIDERLRLFWALIQYEEQTDLHTKSRATDHPQELRELHQTTHTFFDFKKRIQYITEDRCDDAHIALRSGS